MKPTRFYLSLGVAVAVGIAVGVFAERLKHADDSPVVLHKGYVILNTKPFDDHLFALVQAELEGRFAELVGPQQARRYRPMVAPGTVTTFDLYIFGVPGAQPLDDSIDKKLHDFVLERLKFHTEELERTRKGKEQSPPTPN